MYIAARLRPPPRAQRSGGSSTWLPCPSTSCPLVCAVPTHVRAPPGSGLARVVRALLACAVCSPHAPRVLHARAICVCTVCVRARSRDSLLAYSLRAVRAVCCLCTVCVHLNSRCVYTSSPPHHLYYLVSHAVFTWLIVLYCVSALCIIPTY